MEKKTASKKLVLITDSSPSQVGDGFFIRRALPTRRYPNISPFLMLDHAEPTYCEPSDTPKGVDAHPHRGFETVTIVYGGALEHRDSAGNYGKLFAGDVQWMTAASGIVHEEKHEKEFSKNGGTLEMVQLWVNLPAKYKMSAPKYQDISGVNIPVLKTKDEKSIIRVIAGNFDGTQGAADTFTKINIFDIRMQSGGKLDLHLEENTNTIIYVLAGTATFNEENKVNTGMSAFFHEKGTDIEITAEETTKLLVLNGEPINEPTASYGPFVMNTQEEIMMAIHDFNAGKMGRLD